MISSGDEGQLGELVGVALRFGDFCGGPGAGRRSGAARRNRRLGRLAPPVTSWSSPIR